MNGFVPAVWSLLDSIECFLQLQHMSCWDFHSIRFLDVDISVDWGVEERCLDIYLHQFIVSHSCEADENSERGGIEHRCEGALIVDTLYLIMSESTHCETSFCSLNASISLVL